jgi:hypothetical protein
MASPERLEALRQSIAEHERELREAVHEASEAAWRWTDLSDFVREHPGVWMLGGVVLGLWLGGRRRNHG